MANEVDFDYMIRNLGFIVDGDKVERYNYDEIINNLDPNKVVLINWLDTLKEFRDTSGTLWRLSRGATYVGKLRGALESEWGSISIEIVSIPPGTPWGTTVDFALHKVSQLTNMWNLYYDACEDYPGDLGLISGYVVNSMVLVNGNIFIEMKSRLHHSEFNHDKDIRPVAHYLPYHA